MLEVDSDTLLPRNLADSFKKEVLLPFAQELRINSDPCLVLGRATLQTCLGLAKLDPGPQT